LPLLAMSSPPLSRRNRRHCMTVHRTTQNKAVANPWFAKRREGGGGARWVQAQSGVRGHRIQQGPGAEPVVRVSWRWSGVKPSWSWNLFVHFRI